MIKLERINGDTIVAGFPDIYNKNNADIENEFGDIQKKLIEVIKKLKSKVDRNELEQIIERIIKEVLGEYDYVTREEVIALIEQYLKDYDLGEVIGMIEALTERIDKMEKSFDERITRIEEILKGLGSTDDSDPVITIPEDIEERIDEIENNLWYPVIVEVAGVQSYVMKKYKK